MHRQPHGSQPSQSANRAEVDPVRPLAYRVPVAAKVLGFSRAKLYLEAAAGRIEIKKLGAVAVVTHAECERYLAAAPAKAVAA